MIQNLSLDKILTTVGGVMSSSVFSILLIIIFLILGYLLISNKDTIKGRRKFIILNLIVIALALVYYNKGFLKAFDYVVNNIFSVIYFPNLFAYFVGLVLLNIIVWKIFLNKEEDSKLRNVSIIVYLLITYCSILLIGVIAKSKLDVFALDEVYQNVEALSLIRISSIIFVIYLLFLLLYKVYLYYLERRTVEIPEYNKNEAKEYVVKERTLPTNVREVAYPKFASYEDKEYVVKEQPKLEEVNNFERALTLDDYKLLVQMLVDHKKEEELKAKTTNVLEVKNMLERVEPIEPTVKVPTLEEVMPIYKTYKPTTDTVKEVEKTGLYQARKHIIEETEEIPSVLLQDKVEQLLRLYQE